MATDVSGSDRLYLPGIPNQFGSDCRFRSRNVKQPENLNFSNFGGIESRLVFDSFFEALISSGKLSDSYFIVASI